MKRKQLFSQIKQTYKLYVCYCKKKKKLHKYIKSK